jgi:hypothetical protein
LKLDWEKMINELKCILIKEHSVEAERYSFVQELMNVICHEWVKDEWLVRVQNVHECINERIVKYWPIDKGVMKEGK